MKNPDNSLHERLRALSENLWWTWHPEVISLYTDLDPHLWRQVDHNPIAFLSQMTPEEVEERGFGNRVCTVELITLSGASRNMSKEAIPGDPSTAATLSNQPVIYFSAEFGLHESLPIYSGGLGILAGDHLKSASDLGIPLIGIGLLYHQGYFSQHLNKAGWQEEEYVNLDTHTLPIQAITDDKGQPLIIRR